MIIPGYLDGFRPPFPSSPLVDGARLMRADAFWPAFLRTVGGSASAPAAFDVDPADVDALIGVLTDADAWPVFSVRLSGRRRIQGILRNLEGDSGVDYVLDTGSGQAVLPLAALEGHFRGPALSWPELVAVAQRPDPALSPAGRLLLLLPVCADRDRPESAVDVVAAAVTSVGARGSVARGSVARISGELLYSRLWSNDVAWTMVDGLRVCPSSQAYRSFAGDLTPDALRLITGLFAP